MYCMATEDDPVSVQGNMHKPSPCRTLEPDKTGFFQFFSPVGPKATMCRTGHRVFCYPDRGGKEPGNKIVLGKIGTSGHNNPPRLKSRKSTHIRIETAYIIRRRKFGKDI